MSTKRLLFSDGTHITKRNFSTLIDFFSARGVTPHVPKQDDLPIGCHGDYEDHIDRLRRFVETIESKEIDDALDASHLGVNLFDAGRSEALSLLITTEQWIDQQIPVERADLFKSMWERSRRTLILNMAAAMYWIEFWFNYTRTKLNPDYVCVFSGSLTYARSLLEIMKSRPGRVFVLESFFTGNDYYLEERYEPIANRSDLRFSSMQKALALPSSRRAYEIQRNIAFSSIRNMKNKNVQQPPSSGVRVFANGRRTLLLLGQVLNDFSLLEYKGVGLCSIEFYIRFLDSMLKGTDLNIIVKTHPWETKKVHLKSEVTFGRLSTRFEGCDRVKIVSDWPIADLFQEADCVATINSQSGIEAALAGFKVLQVGDAFWGEKGFSHDLTPRDEHGWLRILSNPHQWRLSLSEYDRLEEFLTRALRLWLVGEKSDPTGRLAASFYELPRSPGKPTAAVVKPTPKAPAPKSPATALATTRLTAAPGANETRPTPQYSITALELPNHDKPPANVSRKLRKLMTKPKDFFRDSRYPALRMMAKFAPTR